MNIFGHQLFQNHLWVLVLHLSDKLPYTVIQGFQIAFRIPGGEVGVFGYLCDPFRLIGCSRLQSLHTGCYGSINFFFFGFVNTNGPFFLVLHRLDGDASGKDSTKKSHFLGLNIQFIRFAFVSPDRRHIGTGSFQGLQGI